MQVRIVDEQHNAVTWETRLPLVEVELGIMGGMALIVSVLLLLQNPLRWSFIAGTVILAFAAALYVAVTTPAWERGTVERTPEGGSVTHEMRWPLRRQLQSWQVSLDSLVSVGVAYRMVEETDGQIISAARLFVRPSDDKPTVPLTGWANVVSVEQLAEAFAKATRLPLESP